MKLAGLVDDREAVNEEKKSVQHVSLYRIGQEFGRQWYVVIEAGCSAEHMRGLRGRRLCSSFLVQRCMFSHGVCSRFAVVFTVCGTQFKS